MSGKGSRFKRWVLHPLGRGLTGFPLALFGLVGAPFFLARFPAAAQRGLAIGMGRVPRPEPRPRIHNGRATVFSLATFVPSLLAFAIALLCLEMAFAGYLYPIRPGVIQYLSHPLTPQAGLEGAWGGNTVLGAWAVHALIALPLDVLGLALCLAYARLHDLLVRKQLCRNAS